MNPQDDFNTLADDIRNFGPGLELDAILPRTLFDTTRPLSFIVAIFLGTGAVAGVLFAPEYAAVIDRVGAFALLTFNAWLIQFLIYCYHNSYYYRGFVSLIGSEKRRTDGTTYDVAKVVMKKPDDITEAFLTSPLGSLVIIRLGINETSLDAFLKSQRPAISSAMVVTKPNEIFSLISLGDYLARHDPAFKQFLKDQAIQEVTYQGALRWVVNNHHQRKFKSRWWGKDNLSQTQGVGQELSYGTTYALQRFSRDIRTSAVFSTLTRDSAYAAEKINDIEHILARAKAANVLLIGEPGVGKMDIMIEIGRRMRRGETLGAIDNKHLIVIDTTRLLSAFTEKQSFEYAFITLLNEAAKAGNIILVFENMSSFMRQAEAINVIIPEIMDPYLASPNVQIVVTDTPAMHHNYLETLGAFTRRFEEVLIETPDLSSTTRVLQRVAEAEEKRTQTLFTFQSLAAITESADRYIVDGVMPDKAISFLIDVASKANQDGVAIITDEFVYTVASDKTGIPAGPIQDQERDLLLHLEARLHERVIGQEKAIDAIARTMRRARAGIQQSDRPIGSFLFLGPTGVGKTETAKALAFIFFKSEENMRRIDMSEFSGPDALERLIGNGTQSGVLSDMIQEHPYSVILLDEFEKGATEVHDLFLQILDEGRFTDARGQRINARNCIFIATSNAGAQLIIRTIEQRRELATLETEIIDHIIQNGLFRPELINRFDNTIIFEPLSIEEQGSVASLMLGGLYERIRARGYELTLTRDLIDLLVEKGYSPEFGARPMQRVIQDVVEEKVAQKIIAGEVQKGDTITLSKADFTPAELAV